MSNKKLLYMVGPFSTRSGYGDHARDIFHSFYDLDKFDIKVMDTRWGDTPRNALKEHDENDKKLLNCIMDTPQLDRQPDICVDVRIPNEFQPVGKFNIGITAGIETTAVSPAWLEGVNKMDLNIVPSEHSKQGFTNSHYDKMQEVPNGEKQKIGELKLEKPMEVLFEGVHEEQFKKVDASMSDSDIVKTLDEIKESKCFLFVGLWGNGDFGEDRKDVGRMIRTFYSTFINHPNPPGLILKTSGSNFSIMDKVDCEKKIHSIKSQFPKNMKLPNVYLLHGELDKNEMNILYNHKKVRCMLSFTHGEGFGRPLLEATMVGLPVIASNWSGQLDFLDEEYSILLNGEMGKVPQSQVWKDIIMEESQWFNVNEEQASKILKFAHKNFFDMGVRAKKLMNKNREKFTHKKMTEKLGEILDSYGDRMPKQSTLKLPTLKKIETPKLKKDLPKLKSVKLPKLKKD